MATLYVRQNGNDNNPGNEVDSAFGTIRAAVAASAPDDTIDIGPGEFVVTEAVEILHGLTIQGASIEDTVVRADLQGDRRRYALTLVPRAGRTVDIESAVREVCAAVDGVKVDEVTARDESRVARIDLGAGGDACLDAVLDALGPRGIGVRGVAPEASSLESVFHALTKARETKVEEA